MATKKCPICAEEIQAEALICRYCGARFEGAPPAGAAVPPPPPPPATQPAVPPTASVTLPPGEVREGLVATPRQFFAFQVHALVSIAVLFVVALSFGGMRSLNWAERASGFLVEGARPALIFIGGVIVIILVWSLTVRRLLPRAGVVGRAGVRDSVRALRREQGIRLVLARRGLVAGIVVAIILWLLMEVSAIYNYGNLTDQGWTLRAGMYFALVLPALGALTAALTWPGPGARKVRMDSRGTIYE